MMYLSNTILTSCFIRLAKTHQAFPPGCQPNYLSILFTCLVETPWRNSTIGERQKESLWSYQAGCWLCFPVFPVSGQLALLRS